VAGAIEERGLARFGTDLFKRVDQSRAFIRGQDPNLLQCAREGLGAPAIGIDQPLIEVERAGESLEYLRWPALKSATPKLHFPCLAACAACARTRIGNPIKLMKPSASF